jgi:precorrin-2 dehydrogenase/sirohydrochlorin ferrochelatase
MSYYPILLDLRGKAVLVVGGGAVAQRKIESLLKYDASIYIVSKELTDTLKELVDIGKVRHIGEEFKEKHLEEAFLVIAATDDKDLNHRISRSAGKKGRLINAVDQPSDCSFIVPSIVKRGDLLISISTSGKSPALAKKIRLELDAQFGGEYETFLILMGRVRKEILSLGLSQSENSRIFHEMVDSDMIKALARDDWEAVESILGRILPREMAAQISPWLKACGLWQN